jgi:hypothetical protein
MTDQRLETLYTSLPFLEVDIVLTEGSNSYYGGSKRGGGYEISCGCLFYCSCFLLQLYINGRRIL